MTTGASSLDPFPPAPDGADNPFPALMQQAHIAVAQADASSRLIRVNGRMAELFGYDPAEMLGLTVDQLTHPDSAGATNDVNAALHGGKTSVAYEKRFLRKNGSAFWGSVTVGVVRSADGASRGFIALIADLTLQRRGQRLVECQNEALQLIISDAPLGRVFARLIAFVEAESDGDAVGSVLLLEGNRLRHGAAPSLPAEYHAAVDGLVTDPELGTCAAAAARNEIVITPDLDAAPEWAGFKHLPLALGLRSAWSMPIVSAEGKVLGAFGTYFRRPRGPTELETETVAMFAKTAALAIERNRSAERLRAALQAAEHQQRLYEAVASTTPDLIYVFDLQHRFTYANNALLAMWGRTGEDSIGRTCLELGYEPWHAEMHDREIDQVAATKQPIRGVVAFNGTNGRRFYDYIFAPVIGSSGAVEAIAGTTRDVTDQRRAATAVKFLSDLTQDLAVLTDAQEIIRRTVHAVGRHFEAHRCYFVECLESQNVVKVGENYVRDDAPSLAGTLNLFDFGGRDWWREYSKGDFAVEDTDHHPLIGPAAAAAYTAVGIRSYAVQPVKRGGIWTVVLAVTENRPRAWLADEVHLLENVAARVWALIERARSEVALRAARDEALAASRAKDNFLAVLSHELRTPLNPVLLLASEAASNPRLPAEIRTDFETISRNISLEARLIDDLLDLTRITHNKLPLTLRVHDVHALLAQVSGTLQDELAEKDLTLAQRWEAPTALVNGDEVRLQQIFWNLLRNAVKFTPAGGTVTMATRLDPVRPNVLEVEVSDSGIGLSEVEIAKIFEPFAQGDHENVSGNPRFGGLGLGLAISRRLAELHAGTITARSAGRNRGSTFVVELPLAAGARSVAPPEPAGVAEVAAFPPPAAGVSPRFRRVLLVEDHEPSRQVLARLLASRQMEVVQAATAAEALQRALHHPFDLVISDIGLPDSSGFDLMTILQMRHGCRGISVSGYGTEQDIARSRDAGFMAHITKPVLSSTLDRVLHELGRE